MDTSEIIVTVLVPSLSLLATIMVNRQSAKVSKDTNNTAVMTTSITSKTEAETEAFVRAKEFYLEIINRQDREIVEFRTEVSLLKDKVETLEEENENLQGRVVDLERHEREHHEH